MLSSRSRCSSSQSIKIRRLKATSTCLGLSLESPFKCRGCINSTDELLDCRKKSSSIHSRTYKCEQPWHIAKGEAASLRTIKRYDLVWAHLIENGYPADAMGAPASLLNESTQKAKAKDLPPDICFATNNDSTNSAFTSMSDISTSTGKKESLLTQLAARNQALENLILKLITSLGTQEESSSSTETMVTEEEAPPAEEVAMTPLELLAAAVEELPPVADELPPADEAPAALAEPNARYKMVYLPHLARLINTERCYKQIMEQATSRQKYTGSELGKRLYGAAAALCPQGSLKNLELTIALSHAALLVDSGNEVDISQIATSVPSATSLKEFVLNAAADAMYVASEEILREGSRLFLVADKGALKTANAHFVKIICWYSLRDKRIKTFNLDTTDSDGSSLDCALAVLHSLARLFGGIDRVIAIIFGQATDSGGGGTGYSFQRALTSKGLTAPNEVYLASFCTLHCIQLTLAAPVKHVIGEGGIGSDGEYRCNAMQLLHGVYNLQRHHEPKQWELIWKAAFELVGEGQDDEALLLNNENNESLAGKIRVPAPIMTRWWTIGVCAQFVLQHWATIIAICHGVIQHLNTDQAANKIASGVQALMRTEQVKSDVHLIHAYHSHFLASHFSWLQKGDKELGGKPGFLNRHIAVRYFLMHEDLCAAYDMEGWKLLPVFAGFRESIAVLDADERLEQEKKVNLFFMMATTQLKKHFKVWINELLFLALFSEPATATEVARFLLYPDKTNNMPRENNNFESEMHGRIIDLSKFKEFLYTECEDNTRDKTMGSQHILLHQMAVTYLANSNLCVDMWHAKDTPLLLAAFREHYLVNYSALASNTHLAESQVKDANFCQIKGREENLSSAFSTARSGLVESINVTTLDSFSKRFLKGNRHVTGGMAGTRKRKKDGTDFEEKTTKMRIDGQTRSTAALKLIVAINKNVLEETNMIPAKKLKWDKLRQELDDTENQFVNKRCGVKVEKFILHYDKQKPPNKLQRRTGTIDTMPLVEGKIPFSKLVKDRDIELVKMELRFRSLSTVGPWRDGLLKRLKDDEGNLRVFKPQCPDVCFDYIFEDVNNNV
jgi:hypothetical protein